MMNDDLLNKFDRIEDLPVSEEVLGAYFEGNLQDSERVEVDSWINHDQALRSLVDDCAGSTLYDDAFSRSDSTALDEIGYPPEDCFHDAFRDIGFSSLDSVDIFMEQANELLSGFYSDGLWSSDDWGTNDFGNFSEMDDSFSSNDHLLDTETPDMGDVFDNDLKI